MPPGQNYFGFTEQDSLGGLRDGFHAGAAQSIDGNGRSLDRQAGF
jgi:hypothetical protein